MALSSASLWLFVQASILQGFATPQGCRDDSSILQVKAKASEFTCPHGEPEEYTLADWNPQLYDVGDSPASGVTISSVTPSPICFKAAILARGNSGGDGENDGILACDCNALTMSAPDSTDSSVTSCYVKNAETNTIELTFDEPQSIVSVTFQNIAEDDPAATTFTYEVTSGASSVFTIPRAGAGVASTLYLTGPQTTKPSNVKTVTIVLGGRGALTKMQLCKGAGSLVGDPHVRTQDHGHYTVLQGGTFLAWRFNSETSFSATTTTKAEVDWRIYAHYSADRRSWTRSLLLVDESLGSQRQKLEFSSEECKLRKFLEGKWSTVEASELLQVLEAGEVVTVFNFTRLDDKAAMHIGKKVWTPKGKKVRWDAQLLMATPQGLRSVATLQLRCFPGKHIDIQVIRERMGDARFIQGQLGAHAVELKKEMNGRGKWFKTSSDEEFQVSSSWKDLGGSSETAAFVAQEDEKAKTSLLQDPPSCSPEAEKKALEHCQEALRDATHADDDALDDCVFDVCAGGGDEAAELAADIFSG